MKEWDIKMTDFGLVTKTLKISLIDEKKNETLINGQQSLPLNVSLNLFSWVIQTVCLVKYDQCIIVSVTFFMYKCKMGLRLGYFKVKWWRKKLPNVEQLACNFCHQDKIISKCKLMKNLCVYSCDEIYLMYVEM